MILQAGTRGEGIIDQVVLVVRFNRPAPDQDWWKRKNQRPSTRLKAVSTSGIQVQRPITLSISLGRTVAR